MRKLPNDLQFSIFERDGFACAYCDGKPGSESLAIGHLVPTPLGGTDVPENLVAICRTCKRLKASRISIPMRLCASGPDAQGWTTWKRFGSWRITWCSDAIILEFDDHLWITLNRCHEPDWICHYERKNDSFYERIGVERHAYLTDLANALAFARLVQEPR